MDDTVATPWKIRAQSVGKVYDTAAGPFTAVEDFDLTVGDGEFVAIVGPSGCGKSTVLRMVAGLEDVSSGRIEIARGSDPGKPTNSVVFQEYAIFPWKTVIENVAFGLQMRGISRAERLDVARHWLDRVGLADRRRHYPYQLSGGQQQRVAIARAVAMEPRLMLFDEVTSALDPELVAEVLAVMQDLARSGMTMVVVSHEMLFVRDVATRVVFMDGGLVAQSGTPDEVLHNPQTERLRSFLGRFHGIFGPV